MSRGLCWIRRDLRLTDNRALDLAIEHCDEVVVAFVLDTGILQKQARRDNHRVTFILDSLAEVDRKLQGKGSRLLVLHGEPAHEIPKACNDLAIDAVFCARDYDPNAIKRDIRVGAALAKVGVRLESIKDQVVFEAGEVLSKSNSPFRVFTPYSRAWLERFDPQRDLNALSCNSGRFVAGKTISPMSRPLTHEEIGFVRCEPWLTPGEDSAKKLVEDFSSRIQQYGEVRDFPCLDGGSHLSVHLRFGTISVRDVFRTAVSDDSAGAKKWMMELIWREFYQDILAHHPHVVSTTFSPEYRDLDWPGTDEEFQKWKAGQTGFPLVDAAMRCFAETGWMHNRLRMVTASFLTKDLLVDYRRGEGYFAEQLLDYDLASNNGGWQWAASVGCDAQPYFRVFNPYLQSRKFDPDGAFIRRWVPELADLSRDAIHQPGPSEALERKYPLPIVDHDVQRKRAVAMFEAARKAYAES